jgi:threonine synthase
VDLSTAIPALDGTRVLVKDEATYASGSHKEPAARAVLARAVRDGHRHVVVGTCGDYGRAMAVACRDAGVACTIALTEGWSDGGEWIRATGAHVVTVPGGYEDVVDASRHLVAELAVADGNVHGPYAQEVFAGHCAVVRALPQAPAAVWVPVGNGTTVIAVHRELRALGWATAVHGVGSAGNNPIVTSWPGRYLTLQPAEPQATEHNEPQVNWNALHGPEAMAAVADSGGAVHGVDDRQMLSAQALPAAHGITASASGAAALAGLLARRSPCADAIIGSHVVLITGR